MTIAKVAGTVVSSVRVDGVKQARYLLVEECDQSGKGRNEFLVALDIIGADRGQLVLLAQGSSCRWTKEAEDKPIDTLIVAIVETVDSRGTTIYRAS
jgi:carbon dioxide concentrating mechanism protein CcmL